MALDFDVQKALSEYSVFVSLFAGFGINERDDAILRVHYNTWANGNGPDVQQTDKTEKSKKSKKNKKNKKPKRKARYKSWISEWEQDMERAGAHFMYAPMFSRDDALRPGFISVFEQMKQGDYSFVPTAENELLAEKWNEALNENIVVGRDFLNLILGSLCNGINLQRQYVRNVRESREILEKHIIENKSLLTRTVSAEYRRRLKAAKKLDPHIAQQKLDMHMHLAPEKNTCLMAGGIIRRKSVERAARKVAETFVDALKKYEAYQRGKRSSKNKYPLFNLTYKDILLTDMVAFSVMGLDSLPSCGDYFEILDLLPIEFADQTNDKIKVLNPEDPNHCCKMRISVAKPDKEGTSSAQQHRIKLYSSKLGRIFDFHSDTLTGIIDRAFGVSAHHIMVHARHMDSLKESKKPKGSKITYGQMYEAIYERAKSFFSAMPVCLDEKVSEYINTGSSKRRTTLRGRLRRDALRPLKLLNHADWFLREYADKKERRVLTKRSAGKIRESLADYIGLPDADKFKAVKQRARPVVWRATTCYLFELEATVADSASIFDYNIANGSNISVSVNKHLTTLIDNLNLFTRLHDVLYFRPDPEAPLLDDEKSRFRQIRNDVNDLMVYYTAFVRDKQQVLGSYSKRKKHDSASVIDDYETLCDMYIGLTNKIEIMKETSHAAVIKAKSDMLLVLGSHMLEAQSKLYGIMESGSTVRGNEKDDILLRMRQAMYTVKNRIRHFYQAAQERFSVPVRTAYEKQVLDFKRKVPAIEPHILD